MNHIPDPIIPLMLGLPNGRQLVAIFLSSCILGSSPLLGSMTFEFLCLDLAFHLQSREVNLSQSDSSHVLVLVNHL